MGFVLGAKASANLDNAYSNLAEAKKIGEELNIAATVCNSITGNAFMFERLLIRLDTLFIPLVQMMEITISNKGVNFRNFSIEEKQNIAGAASIAKAIKTVLDTPLLTDSGKINDESIQVANGIKRELLDKP
jgi:hypothetical protein